MTRRRLTVAALGLVAAGAPGCQCTTTVTAQAISGLGTTPMAGVRMQADDGPWEVTDGEGMVVLQDVRLVFTLHVHQTTEIEGLRSDHYWALVNPPGDPVVVLVSGSYLPMRRSYALGTVSGGTGGPVYIHATHESRDFMRVGSRTGNGPFNVYVTWERPGPLVSVLRALETDGMLIYVPPSHFRRYGETTVTLDDPGGGGSTSGISIELQPIVEDTVTASVVVPPALSNATVMYGNKLRFPGGELLVLGTESAGTDVTINYPRVPGGTPWLSAGAFEWGDRQTASSSYGRAVTAPSSGLVLELPAPVDLLEPADGATIGPGTVFRWTGGPDGGWYGLGVSCTWTDGNGIGRAADYSFLGGRATEATLPELPGLTIDSGADCEWNAFWMPVGSYLGATLAESEWSEYRHSSSRRRNATFR